MKLAKTSQIGITTAITAIALVQADALVGFLFEILHLSFELLEFTLDKLIEHIFHTSRHTSQTIVFYLMLSIAGFILYKLMRRVQKWYRSVKIRLTAAEKRLKNHSQNVWHSASTGNKAKLWALLTISAGLLILGISS